MPSPTKYRPTLKPTPHPISPTTTILHQFPLRINHKIKLSRFHLYLILIITGLGALGTLLTSYFLTTRPTITPSRAALTGQPTISQALSFNGSSGYLDTQYTANPSTYTIEAWIKPASWGENELGRIISKKKTTDSGSQEIYNLFLVAYGANRLQFERTFSGGLGVWATPNNSFQADNLWHHIAVSYNDSLTSKPSIYIDGVLKQVNTLRVPIGSRVTGTGDFLIGNRDTQDRTFKGIIEEVRIWNTIRSASQIQSNKNIEISPTTSGLISYFRFDEGAGSTTSDLKRGTTTTIPASITWTQGYMPVISSPVPPSSCNSYNFVKGSINPSNVSPGGAVSITCDYGAGLDCVGSWSSPSNYTNHQFIKFNGPTAEFTANAPTSPGTYTNYCALGSGTTSNCCARNDQAGSFTVTSAAIPTPTPTPQPISTQSVCQKKIPAINATIDAYDQADPDINQSHNTTTHKATIAYKTKRSISGKYTDIYTVNINDACLTAGNCNNSFAWNDAEVTEPVISNNWVAWTESYIVGGLVQHHNIRAKHFASGLKCQIAGEDYNEISPALLKPASSGWENYISWTGYTTRTNADIYGLSLSHETPPYVCPDVSTKVIISNPTAYSEQSSDLSSNNYAVWEYNNTIVGYGYDIYYKSDFQLGGQITPLNIAGDQNNPAIYGKKIVWTDSRTAGNKEIYYYDIDHPVSGGTNFSNTNANIFDTNPDIYGDWIVWERANYNTGVYAIVAKNLTGGAEKILVSGPSVVANPAIYENMVVWEDARNGNLDIYYDEVDCSSGTVNTCVSFCESIRPGNMRYCSDYSDRCALNIGVNFGERATTLGATSDFDCAPNWCCCTLLQPIPTFPPSP